MFHSTKPVNRDPDLATNSQRHGFGTGFFNKDRPRNAAALSVSDDEPTAGVSRLFLKMAWSKGQGHPGRPLRLLSFDRCCVTPVSLGEVLSISGVLSFGGAGVEDRHAGSST